jgi:hypothetical protein
MPSCIFKYNKWPPTSNYTNSNAYSNFYMYSFALPVKSRYIPVGHYSHDRLEVESGKSNLSIAISASSKLALNLVLLLLILHS